MKILLKTIKSSPLSEVYQRLISRAMWWGMLGKIAAANELLECLWRKDQFRELKVNTYDRRALTQLWTQSGEFPASLPFERQSSEEIDALNWARHFAPSADFFPDDLTVLPSALQEQWRATKKLRAGLKLAYAKEADRGIAKPDNLAQALAAIEEYLETRPLVGHEKLNTLMKATLLAARSESDRAKPLLQAWGTAYQKTPENGIPMELMSDAKVAALLVSGTLAPTASENEANIKAELELFQQALAERLEEGAALLAPTRNWQDLLMEVQAQSIAKEEITAEEVWLAPAATTAAVAAAEQRLGCKLGPEYRSFLSCTNGLPKHSEVSPSIHKIEEVAWLSERDPELIALEREVDETGEWKRLSQSLLIGGYEEEQQLLLLPPAEGAGVWECWFWASWNMGATKYLSIRDYFEHELAELMEAGDV